ncbi:MAG: ABC transporter substrate-binding protein [Peptococcaceae bacterium]|jgi:ABC-type transport system substrate-binding protein|nr:ABC transporter substrate-binding protein [Peptococcaceae bacterium]MDH7524456.1 ABC transporter substrate-binding protein [Peptococcaceae bacterium]
MRKSISIISLLLVFVMLFTLTGCGKSTDKSAEPASAPTAKTELTKTTIPWYRGEITVMQSKDTGFKKKTPPGTVVYATSGQIIGADPMNSQEEYPWSHNVYEGLLTRDWKTGEIKGLLATEWKYDDKGNLNITLREGVKFHDGTTLDAEDVLFTLKRTATHPKSKIAEATSKIDFAKSFKKDATHLTLVFKEPSGALISVLASGWAGIMSKEFVESKGKDYDYMDADAGTGPYKLVETVTGNSQTFKRFDEYWGEKPEVEAVVYKLFKDYTAMAIAYQNGELDFTLNNNYDTVKRFMNGEITDTTYYRIGVNRSQHLQLTTLGGTPLKDVRIRQALAYCIDYKSLIVGTYESEEMANLPRSIFMGGIKYAINLGTYEYNPEKAKQLLAEAGYSKDKPLELKLMTSDNVNNMAAAQIVQNYAAEIGIKISVTSQNSTAMTKDINDKNIPSKWDIVLTSTNYGSGDPDDFLAGRAAYGKQPGTFSANMGIDDQKLCDLMAQGSATIDEAKRAEIYKEIQQMFYDQCWVIPLNVRTSNVLCRSYLQNTEFLSGYHPRFASWKLAQ